MAITGSFNINNTIALSDGSHKETINSFRLNVEYSIDAVKGEQAYSIKIRCRLVSDYDMYYTSLATKLNISVDNAGSYTEIGAPQMEIWVGSQGGAGPWTQWYTFKHKVGESKSTIKMNVFLDLSKIVGSQSGQIGGPDYIVRPGYHFREFVGSKSIDVSGIVIGRKPTLASLENNNKYNNPTSGLQAAVSASTTSLSIKINASDWGDPSATAYWSCSGKTGSTKSAVFNITNLSPGTNYTVNVYLKNSIGQSSSKSITIRTKHNNPVIGLSVSSVDLEKINLNWTSDKDITNTQYKIDDGGWTDLNQTGRSGSFTAKWFGPKTTHTIYFRGKSTSTYDSIETSIATAQGTTLDISHITSIGECIFGLPININIDGESQKQLQLEIWTEGNGMSPKFTFNVSKGLFTFSPTQDQLDKMYRCYPKSNQVPIHFLLTTKGEWKNWQDSSQNKNLQLTGIAKTCHIGVNNSSRRVQVWIGDSNNVPRRAVTWFGVSDTPHRTI